MGEREGEDGLINPMDHDDDDDLKSLTWPPTNKTTCFFSVGYECDKVIIELKWPNQPHTHTNSLVILWGPFSSFVLKPSSKTTTTKIVIFKKTKTCFSFFFFVFCSCLKSCVLQQQQ